MLAALGGGWVFGSGALFCLLGLLFSWRYVPETKGLVLEEVSGALRRLWAPRTAVPLE